MKVNKQKLVMEEVEQFDSISLEELAEGVYVAVVRAACLLTASIWLCLLRFGSLTT